MPVQKDFKRLVRGRMAKTGESYTAARSQLRSAASPAPAVEPLRYSTTAALVRALANAGVTISEPMLFGIGGGIGAAYFVFQYKDFTSLYVGGRINEYVLKGDFAETICRRLGVLGKLQQTTSAKTAEKQLHAALDGGDAPVITVDQASLAVYGLPKQLSGMMPYTVIVGVQNGQPVLFDREPQPHPITWTELAAARSRIKSAKNRMLTVQQPAKPLDLTSAVLDGIRTTCRGMLQPPLKNFGVPSLEKWAALITDTKDKRCGWPRVFASDKLADALKWVKHWIEVDTGGGNYRALYADFLDEAAGAIKRPALRDVARQYRGLAAQWTALTELRELTALHDAVLKLATAERQAAMALQAASN